MNDKELKETLASICQILKDEIFYTDSVNASMIALARSILAQNDGLAHRYDTEWRKIAFGVPPTETQPTSGHLQRLDALIQKLKD